MLSLQETCPPHAIVVGNPARIQGYSTTLITDAQDAVGSEAAELNIKINVPRASVILMPTITDLRGNLTFGEYGKELPFIPKRYFIVFDVPSKDVRGEHAHRDLHQLLVCVKGSCCVALDDGVNRDRVVLDTPAKGLYLPPMIWATQYKYSQDAVLLVLASEKYDNADYIRDYDEFVGLININK